MAHVDSSERVISRKRPVRENRSWLQRAAIGTAIIVPVLYALIINLSALDSPPAWDSVITVSPAALTIVDHDFNIWEVAQLPSALDGGPSIHATSIYTIGLAVLIWIFGPANAFYVAHLGSIALVGALSASTYLLARGRASVYFSALAAATVSIIPLVVQQASDIYIDLPLAVVATLTCWAASRRRFWVTAGLVVFAVAIKTSGVFLIPLLLLAKPAEKPLRRHLVHSAVAGTVALVPFLIAFATTDRFDQGGQPWADLTLINSSALALFLTTDLLVILLAFVIVVFFRARSGTIDHTTRVSALAVLTLLGTYAGTALLSGTIMILPRYYIAVLPAMLVALLPSEEDSAHQWSAARLVSLGFIVAVAVFSLANVRGDFYYLPNHDFPVIAERSTRAQDLLELQVIGSQRLVETRLPLIVERQIFFQLAYPEMGYVEEIPERMITTFDPIEELPDSFAMLIEWRHQNPLVAVEDRANSEGYTLEYEDLTNGGFTSQLIIASR